MPGKTTAEKNEELGLIDQQNRKKKTSQLQSRLFSRRFELRVA